MSVGPFLSLESHLRPQNEGSTQGTPDKRHTSLKTQCGFKSSCTGYATGAHTRWLHSIYNGTSGERAASKEEPSSSTRPAPSSACGNSSGARRGSVGTAPEATQRAPAAQTRGRLRAQSPGHRRPVPGVGTIPRVPSGHGCTIAEQSSSNTTVPVPCPSTEDTSPDLRTALCRPYLRTGSAMGHRLDNVLQTMLLHARAQREPVWILATVCSVVRDGGNQPSTTPSYGRCPVETEHQSVRTCIARGTQAPHRKQTSHLSPCARHHLRPGAAARDHGKASDASVPLVDLLPSTHSGTEHRSPAW